MPWYPGRRAGTWRVTVWANRRQHEEIIEGKESDARAYEAKMRVDLQKVRSPTQRRTEPTFSVFSMADYQPQARVHLGANTWKSRKTIVTTLAAFFGHLRPSEITDPLVTEYTTDRLRTVQRSSVNHELRVLSAMLRFAREDCGYPVRLVRIRKLRQDHRRVHFWTRLEEAKLVRTCRQLDPELAPLVVFMLQTGVRKTEGIRAVWEWVARRRGAPLLLVGPTDDWTTKSRRPREVPITAELARLLDRLPRRGRWIFGRLDGERFTNFPRERFETIVKAAKLRGTPHTCRHTFASRFLDAGGSLYDLAALLGHSATRTTELYAHLLPSHLDRARAVLNATARVPSLARAAG